MLLRRQLCERRFRGVCRRYDAARLQSRYARGRGLQLDRPLCRSECRLLFDFWRYHAAWFSCESGSGDGGFFGGQIGVNWQAPGSPWVFGLEGDVGATFSDRGDPPAATVNTISVDLKPIGTARGRVGYAVDRALWYVTGGLAWADHEVTLSGPAIGGSISTSKVHTGWTIGGGLEWAFADAWSAKIEYLYMSLGSEHYFPNIVGAPGFEIGFDIQTVKAGLNYNFGGGKGPVVAKY